MNVKVLKNRQVAAYNYVSQLFCSKIFQNPCRGKVKFLQLSTDFTLKNSLPYQFKVKNFFDYRLIGQNFLPENIHFNTSLTRKGDQSQSTTTASNFDSSGPNSNSLKWENIGMRLQKDLLLYCYSLYWMFAKKITRFEI